MNTQKKVSKGSKSKTRNTRSSTKTNLCGLPSLLPLNTLPTKKETISFFELTKEEKIGSGNLTKKLRPSLLTKVADSVFEIWKRACVPTISKCNIVKMIDRLVSKYYKVKHNLNQSGHSAKLTKFCSEIDCLFDIFQCRCYFKNIPKKKVKHCKKCDVSDCDSFEFYFDQRGSREMKIAIVAKTSLFLITSHFKLQKTFQQ